VQDKIDKFSFALLISVTMVLEERESCWTDTLIKLKMRGG